MIRINLPSVTPTAFLYPCFIFIIILYHLTGQCVNKEKTIIKYFREYNYSFSSTRRTKIPVAQSKTETPRKFVLKPSVYASPYREEILYATSAIRRGSFFAFAFFSTVSADLRNIVVQKNSASNAALTRIFLGYLPKCCCTLFFCFFH